ncbi:class I SAM-dependent methyltransferase [Marivirga arenosa]|uniref:Class I SAM-dependent methyltransferase n=1 Tax=Marivirga arenosa TaxID=3059076 RepID=A0AA51R7J6_9BACT|nr:class I SAM-dependent methyltransferase [Marivirga sp. ABR2-2]WMN07702.1 class I SAM-dependent methyltransferase [Marivirga sp. ABR2-2]
MGKIKESGLIRLNPPLWHSRYVHLKLLKRHILRWVEEYVEPVKVQTLVDMGCGDLPYKSLVNPHVESFIGVDIEGNTKADTYVNLHTNKTEIKDNTADLVWSVQVLEHVENPNAYLKECYRILKKGEKLLLSTHGHWLYHPDPVDNWRWTCTGLQKEIEKAGFKVHEVKGMMGLLSMSVQLFQDACLIHFPFVKYWKAPFCFLMQRIIQLTEFYTNLSKTTRAYVDKDACIFFVVAEKE